MTKYRVTTPQPGHSGAVGAVHFADGVAVVDDETHAAELAYFRAQGYGCHELDDSAGDPVKRAARIDELESELARLRAEEQDALAAAEEAAESDGDPGAADMPKKSASTEEWRAYAKASGMPAEEADAMSRTQLADHYTKEAAK